MHRLLLPLQISCIAGWFPVWVASCWITLAGAPISRTNHCTSWWKCPVNMCTFFGCSFDCFPPLTSSATWFLNIIVSAGLVANRSTGLIAPPKANIRNILSSPLASVIIWFTSPGVNTIGHSMTCFAAFLLMEAITSFISGSLEMSFPRRLKAPIIAPASVSIVLHLKLFDFCLSKMYSATRLASDVVVRPTISSTDPVHLHIEFILCRTVSCLVSVFGTRAPRANSGSSS